METSEISMRIQNIKKLTYFIHKWIRRNHRNLIIYDIFKMLMNGIFELEKMITKKGLPTELHTSVVKKLQITSIIAKKN